jgi:hypothetical protein
MPDTGAPWNIPYADPTDLVRDWPDLSEDVADAVAAGLSAASSPGLGTNVVSGARTSNFNTTSTSYVTVTDVTATITPTSNTSKVLVIVTSNLFGNLATSGSGYQMIVARDGTQISGDPFIQYKPVTSGERGIIGVAALVLDSPNTIAATTYDLRLRAEATTTATAAYRSAIVAIEVKA